MLSDQQVGKKEVEMEELLPFLEARKWITGEALNILEGTENPDFICGRPGGGLVGIELTKVTRDKNDIFWERILDRKEYIDPYEAQEIMCYLIEKKEGARMARYTARVPECILVLQLVDGSLDLLVSILDGLHEDFMSHGFVEAWLADYSGLEAYNDIELFGLYPKRWWGYHERALPDRKPYG